MGLCLSEHEAPNALEFRASVSLRPPPVSVKCQVPSSDCALVCERDVSGPFCPATAEDEHGRLRKLARWPGQDLHSHELLGCLEEVVRARTRREGRLAACAGRDDFSSRHMAGVQRRQFL